MKPDLEIPFHDLLEAILDENTQLKTRFLFRLSDLEGEELEELNAIWERITIFRRQRLLEDLELLADSNLVLSFDSIYRLALSDEDPIVRTSSIRSLWGSDEMDLIPIFLNLLEDDEFLEVRAQAASSLGHFIFLGELGEIKDVLWKPVVEKLTEVLESNEQPIVRRRALESLGFSNRSVVPSQILEAYEFGDEDWIVSALFAMSRSASEEWGPYVMKIFEHQNTEIRTMAAKAAGELELEEATPDLLMFLEEEDDEVRMAAVWALAEIAGEGAQEGLENLLGSTEDEDEIDLIESALENLSFNEDIHNFNLFDVLDQNNGNAVDAVDNGDFP